MIGNGALRKTDIVKSVCDGLRSGPYLTGCKKCVVEKRPAIRMLNKSVPGLLITGSTKVFLEGLPAGRKKDKVVCGVNLTGSSKVIYG